MSYVDTSALVAYYCPEPLSRKAEKAIRSTELPAISSLTEVEFCSALAIKTRTGDLDVEAARRVLACFRAHRSDGGYRILPLPARVYAMACEWLGAFATPLRTVDALHLAAAFTHDLPILTADGNLARSAKHFGVRCKLIS